MALSMSTEHETAGTAVASPLHGLSDSVSTSSSGGGNGTSTGSSLGLVASAGEGFGAVLVDLVFPTMVLAVYALLRLNKHMEKKWPVQARPLFATVGTLLLGWHGWVLYSLIEWSNTPSTPYALYSCNAYLTPTSNEGDVQAELRLKEILQQFLFMFFATEMLFAFRASLRKDKYNRWIPAVITYWFATRYYSSGDMWSLALLQTIGNAMKLLRVVFPSLPMFLNNVPYISMSLHYVFTLIAECSAYPMIVLVYNFSIWPESIAIATAVWLLKYCVIGMPQLIYWLVEGASWLTIVSSTIAFVSLVPMVWSKLRPLFVKASPLDRPNQYSLRPGPRLERMRRQAEHGRQLAAAVRRERVKGDRSSTEELMLRLTQQYEDRINQENDESDTDFDYEPDKPDNDNDDDASTVQSDLDDVDYENIAETDVDESEEGLEMDNLELRELIREQGLSLRTLVPKIMLARDRWQKLALHVISGQSRGTNHRYWSSFVRMWNANKRNYLLMARLRRVMGTDDDNDEDRGNKPQPVCVICLDRPRDTVLEPCGHACVCRDCASILCAMQATSNSRSLRVCPMCRTQICSSSSAT